ncbi:NAD(P)-binding protein [Zopfia rhizophila CBS 207.26]|uniref:NAD(P)-binding protein n=1 Tax=Zopfia rhizophila CBS 207.26 TaxID=1314779 RepID=A0A6A6EPY2_9PEZI|nr:NAD(P)-binding protein [Zopfia rhizophila CBS 207.26]
MADSLLDRLTTFNRHNYTPSFVKTVHSKPYPAIDPTQPSLSAAGKTILITGGATGIGNAIARNFAAANASTIILLARRASTLETASAALSIAYPSTQVLTYSVDIADEYGVDKVFKQAVSDTTNHSIDILVTSAVYLHAQKAMLNISAPEIRASFETNVMGNLSLVRHFLSTPNPSKTQKIILDVSSEGIFNNLPTVSVYGASKYGFTFLLRHIQTENPDIRVHSFHPGAVYTPNVKSFGIPREALEPILDDVELPGAFAVWLASPQAEFLKGKMSFAKWDVEDLKANREVFEKDPNFGTVSMHV